MNLLYRGRANIRKLFPKQFTKTGLGLGLGLGRWNLMSEEKQLI